MSINKTTILDNICYTKLVYGRINKKLNGEYSNQAIKQLLYEIINCTQEEFFQKKGKNIYVSNIENNIRITINSNTYRIITVDEIEKLKKQRKYDKRI